MKRKRLMKRVVTGVLAGMMMLGVMGCTKTPAVPSGPIAVDPQPVNKVPVVENLTNEEREICRKALVDMAFRLVNQSTADKTACNENSMMSPLSVSLALAMTANGAKDETLAQMETFLGGEDAKLDLMNAFLHEYAFNLPSSDRTKVRVANSIWYRDSENLALTEHFKDANHQFYNAVLKVAKFDDQTVRDINQWCSDNTDKMIPSIVNELREETMICLFNAIVFDGKWDVEYEEADVFDDIFTDAQGKKIPLKMLNSTEMTFLENDLLTGTIKPYKDGYEFIALLPKEGVTVDEVLAGLNGDSYFELFENAKTGEVFTHIPEFEVKDEYQLIPVLRKMGMVDPFDRFVADFSDMATCTDGPLFISNVIHKTYIKVDRHGTKAAAVTGVYMDGCTAIDPEYCHEVYLDRPFAYVIADSRTHTPIFVGVTNTIE